MFVADAHSPSVVGWLSAEPRAVTLSDWTVAEFISVLGVATRGGRIRTAAKHAAEQALDTWIGQHGSALAVLSEDVRRARVLMNQTGLPLRASDALHLAVARRTGHVLATFDAGMRRAAEDLGLPVEDLSPHP